MNIGYELIYTLRLLRKKLGFSFLCIIVVALGYLICLPLYSFVKNFAYTTLPYPEGDRLVVFKPIETPSGLEQATTNFDFFQFEAINQRSTAFEQLGAYRSIVANLSDGDFALPYGGVEITVDALGFSATTPILGRSFQSADEAVGAEAVVLISSEVWKNYYLSDPEIIGRTARVSGKFATIIGVMPDEFRYPYAENIWLPLSLPTTAQPDEGSSITIVGKLNDNISLDYATQELSSILSDLSAEYPANYSNRSAEVQPFTQGFINNGLFIMNSIGAVAVSLFILICLNVSNLLVIRASERIKELSIRSAVGARRIGLMAHVLLESFIVCLSGATLGILGSSWLLKQMQFVFETQVSSNVEMPFWFNFSFDWEIFILSILMLIAIWLLSGIFSAWHVSKGDLSSALNSYSRAVVAEKGGRITRFIVHVQMTVSFFLLLLSGAFLFNFQAINTEGVLANADDYVVATIDLSNEPYDEMEPAQLFIEQLGQLLSLRNEFESVSFGSAHPGGASSRIRATFQESIDSEQDALEFGENWISDNYFQTLDFPLVEGRFFDETDTSQSLSVVIVEETFSTRMGLSASPVGRRIQLFDSNLNSAGQATIVGVVPQSNIAGNSNNGTSLLFRPIAQNASTTPMFPIARINPDLGLPFSEFETTIREAVSEIDRDVPVYSVGFLSNSYEANRTIFSMMLAMFSAASIGALALAVISIYGLISRAVLSRANEVGIRRAVGSTDFRITMLFLSQGFFYLVSAFVIGGSLGLLGMNAIQSSLASLPSFNFLTTVIVVFSTVSLTVITLVYVGSYLPSRKIVAMEPGEALRYE